MYQIQLQLALCALVRQHQFHVHIDSNCMAFALKGQTLFSVPIDRSNTAYLSGTVVPPQSALVSASFTLPLNETLWHRRFAHFHHAGVQRIVSESLVTDMKLQSSSKVDPFSERCCRVFQPSSEGITAMLATAGLPPQFWAEALASLLHVLNRTPTSSLPHTTSYKCWFKSKPDVSHLRVWGRLAYVHVQKDKQGSHMEKCIFIGYPADYKGWKFYNPKKAVIFEQAVFDERYFPGLKNWSSLPSNCSHPPTQPITHLMGTASLMCQSCLKLKLRGRINV